MKGSQKYILFGSALVAIGVVLMNTLTSGSAGIAFIAMGGALFAIGINLRKKE